MPQSRERVMMRSRRVRTARPHGAEGGVPVQDPPAVNHDDADGASISVGVVFADCEDFPEAGISGELLGLSAERLLLLKGSDAVEPDFHLLSATQDCDGLLTTTSLPAFLSSLLGEIVESCGNTEDSVKDGEQKKIANRKEIDIKRYRDSD